MNRPLLVLHYQKDTYYTWRQSPLVHSTEVNHNGWRMGHWESTGLLVTERQGYYRPVTCGVGLRNLEPQDLRWFSNYLSTTWSNLVPVALEEKISTDAHRHFRLVSCAHPPQENNAISVVVFTAAMPAAVFRLSDNGCSVVTPALLKMYLFIGYSKYLYIKTCDGRTPVIEKDVAV